VAKRPSTPTIAFLTDYGLADDFVGICHGVIAQRCPRARIIDLTHGIPPHDVRAGALMLARALAYLPVGVVLAVVDPGVGGPRRGVAIRAADGRRLVGPDNGLLSPALNAAGGPREAVDLSGSPFALAPISATFHGRDVFAPVAAALADGVALARVGEPVDPGSLVALELPAATDAAGALVAHVVWIDRFGNLQLDAVAADLLAAELGGRDEVQITFSGGRLRARLGRAFADVADGELVLYEDAQGALAVAVNRGSAARRLGVGVDAELRVTAP
jgi:S-adenosylmethionine hydrolase